MRKIASKLAGQQSGFTLIELVIVIVIVGILAAVAIPQFGSVADSAQKATNNAVLGAAKSAWSGAYAVKKGYPTPAEVASLVAGSTGALCSGGTGVISCPVTWLSVAGGSTGGSLVITATSSTSPANWVCATTADCG